MIRKLLATTALATLIATGGAYAQTTAPTDTMAPAEQAVPNVIHAEGHLASNLIGQNVYNSANDDAENIGSVNDLVISDDGDVEAIVVGVGGFLGIGQKNVALEYAAIEWADRDGERWLIVPTDRETLESLEEFDTAAYRPQPADAQVGNTTPATAQQIGAAPAGDTGAAAPAATTDTAQDETLNGDTGMEDDVAAAPAGDAATTDDTSAAAPADTTAPAATEDTAQAPAADAVDDTETSAIDRSTLTETAVTGMSADDFIGTTVYGANDENVGSINDVILSSDGNTVEGVIIDVGGFLGIGAKSVAVGMDNLSFLSDADGDNYLYTQFTQEQLEAQPEYDSSTFAENRDEQLLIVPAQ